MGKHEGAPEDPSVYDTDLSVETDYEPRHIEVLADEIVNEELGKKALSLEGLVPLGDIYGPNEHLRDKIRVFHQGKAINAVIDALDRKTVRLEGDSRPESVLLFSGPTGTGKSEMGKELARVLDYNFLKIDSADYAQGHNVAKLTGSAPGYVGHEIVPILNQKDIERSVVMFDELEKGSPEYFDLLLAINGDGTLTDAKGEKLNFRNTIVIMTTNIGAQEMTKTVDGGAGFSPVKAGKPDEEKISAIALDKFKDFFRARPEFVNRITKQVVFNFLNKEALGMILDSKLEVANEEYQAKLGSRIELSELAKEYIIAEAEKEPAFGARPLVRALEEKVYPAFGRYVSTGYIEDGTKLYVCSREELSEEQQAIANDSPLQFFPIVDETLKKPVSPEAVAAQAKEAAKQIASASKDLVPYDQENDPYPPANSYADNDSDSDSDEEFGYGDDELDFAEDKELEEEERRSSEEEKRSSVRGILLTEDDIKEFSEAYKHEALAYGYDAWLSAKNAGRFLGGIARMKYYSYILRKEKQARLDSDA